MRRRDLLPESLKNGACPGLSPEVGCFEHGNEHSS
jgi:hypothetical protein